MLSALATSVLVGLLILAGGIVLTVGIIAWLTRHTIRTVDGEQ